MKRNHLKIIDDQQQKHTTYNFFFSKIERNDEADEHDAHAHHKKFKLQSVYFAGSSIFSCNNSHKISGIIYELWAGILSQMLTSINSIIFDSDNNNITKIEAQVHMFYYTL